MKRILTTLKEKWPEYLLEILVLIIGIYGAFAMDNWNEERKDRQKEQQVLTELKAEYQSNLDQLDQKTNMRNQMLEAAHNIFRYIDSPSIAHRDSLMMFLFSISRDPTFDPIQNDLIASGNLRLLQNDSLRMMLSNWTTEVYQLQEIEREWQKVRSEVGTEMGIKLGITRDFTHQLWKDGYTPIEALDQSVNIKRKVGPSKNTLDLPSILSSRELEGFSACVVTWSQVANIQGQALRSRIQAILSLIDEELAKK
ncbi:MAG: DUF6090 family protein [Ekhidna sp.]